MQSSFKYFVKLSFVTVCIHEDPVAWFCIQEDLRTTKLFYVEDRYMYSVRLTVDSCRVTYVLQPGGEVADGLLVAVFPL